MLSVLWLLVQSAGAPQPVYDGRLHQTDVHSPRIDAGVTVDGVLDEEVWHQAALLKGFTQYRPVDSRPVADSTEVLAFYAPDAIYFGIRAYEGHAGAAGGQNAGFRFDGVVDLNPDYVYESKGHITPWGYEVEVRIPFKSLRYQSGATQDWGLQIIRVTQHTGYEDTWTPVVRANASFLIQSGTLKALTGLRRGLVMDVSPEFTSRLDGAPASPSSYQYKSIDPELGVNLRWGITQNLSAAGTVNPDFSQVEADVGQVTVNQRFALFFPEKRPFFLEGLEQFDTPNALIYTRRIAAPIAGTKLTGKIGGTAVAYIGAVDDNGIPNGPHPVVNLLRLRRDLGASSTLGLAYTDRIEGSDWNRVVGTDARVIWKKIWFSDAQIVGSWTKDVVGGAARAGALWDVTLYDRTGYAYGNHAELVGISPQFAALSGFVNRVNVVQGRFANRFTRYGKPGALLENATTFILVQPTWRYRDFFDLGSTLEGSINDNLILTFRGGWNVSTYLANDHQRFDPPDYSGHQVDSSGVLRPFVIPHGLYNLWSGIVALAPPDRTVKINISVGRRSGAIFSEAAEGRAWNIFLAGTWKPTSDR